MAQLPRPTPFPYTTLFRSVSGPAIHAEALRMVERAVRAVKVPVIGVGGILCGADAMEFLRAGAVAVQVGDRKSTRLNSSHPSISYAVFCLKKKTASAGASV